MKKLVSMRAALNDTHLFGTVLAGDSWAAWRILLIAMLGEPLTAEERVVFHALTGREVEPGEPVDEFWGIIGRRGGKSRAIAVLGAYIGALVDIKHLLAPGEPAVLPILSASVSQAKKIYQYVDGIFSNVPALKRLVLEQTADTIKLATRVEIEVKAASFRTIRSGTMASILVDEAAFFRSDNSANPDAEILNAARPGLATTGGLLAVISSPYAKTGEVYKTFRRDFGPNGDPRILVAKAASRVMNPGLSQAFVDRAFAKDPAAAAAEYGGEFRNDVEAFINPEAIEAVTIRGRFELPPLSEFSYLAFVDPSGGSADSMTLAISHREEDRFILDCMREVKPPFSPDSVVQDFAELMKSYHLVAVTGDRYSAEWVRERFSMHGIRYHQSDKTKSDIYREFLPLVNSGRVELLDSPRLMTQICSLERRTARGGRDSIDHAPGGHDDLANAAAGSLVWSATRVLSMMDVL
ncbi:MAG: hypothetical protein JWM36_688 [Hyphomicrobiales bacterium]|nr:hypothetical protein [Hyphomicrobiales bacterium]